MSTSIIIKSWNKDDIIIITITINMTTIYESDDVKEILDDRRDLYYIILKWNQAT